jgi:hypothetical protein
MAQYDRVDPTEFQSLKDEIESLKAEKSAWEAQQLSHAEQSTEQSEKVIATHSPGADKSVSYDDERRRSLIWRK